MVYDPNGLDTMFGDTEDSITIGDATGPCILLEGDVLAEGQGPAPAVLRMVQALVQAATFPEVQVGDEATVNGRLFTVARRLLIQDGACIELELRTED